MLAYWGLAKETAAAMAPSGWLRTGDIGCMDKQVAEELPNIRH